MDAFPITWDFLRDTIWLPFYFASDMMIDMIIDLQESSSLKVKIIFIRTTLYYHIVIREIVSSFLHYILVSPSYSL